MIAYPFTFEETPDSGDANMAHPAEVNLEYLAAGETDEAIATSLALSSTPITRPSLVGILYRHPPTIRPAGYARYLFSFKYSAEPYVLGGVTFNFDTSGATIRVPASAVHVGTWNEAGLVTTGGGAPGTASNPHSNVIAGGEGAEVVIPALKISYTRRNPLGFVTESYAKVLASITGCVNSVTFRSFAGGELLFLGASGSDGTNAEAECTYHFVASQNTSLNIGAIGVFKYGHDVLWVEHEPIAVSGTQGRTITRVHTERMQSWIDFAANLGWA